MDFNPRSPDDISEIDNLLQQDSLFESENGDKILQFITKKKRAEGGRVRLHEIFQRVQMQRPAFNYDLDTSDPTPLPQSPVAVLALEPATTSAETNGEAAVQTTPVDPPEQPVDPPVQPVDPSELLVIQNGHRKSIRFTSKGSQVIKKLNGNSGFPMVVLNDISALNQAPQSSSNQISTMGRKVLINQYQRTNAAKCEMLRQLAASTPKPDVGSSSRLSTFTTSISPISEGTPAVTHHQEVQPTPPFTVEIVAQQVLAPCSQPAEPVIATPHKKVIVENIPALVEPEMIIPETPSPAKETIDSPKAPPTGTAVKPRRLSATFRQLEAEPKEEIIVAATVNGHITSDESGEAEVTIRSPTQATVLKTILKDTSMSTSSRDRQSLRVSFSQHLVQQREISPAPSIPEANYSDSDSDDDGDSDSSESSEEYRVVDEVYSGDENAEDAPDVPASGYDELTELQRELDRADRSPENHLHLFESLTPGRRLPDHYPLEQCDVPPGTVVKNKTDMQLVDIITDWDDEEDEEGAQTDEQQNGKHSADVVVPETQQSNNQNETNLDTMDISSSNMEDSNERVIELPPPPDTPTAVDKSPPRSYTPPPQFTDSAKRRFLRENDDAVISRLQNDLPNSQPIDQTCPPEPPSSAEVMQSFEKVSETLMEIAQSFRDQPQPAPKLPEPETKRKVIAPPRKTRGQAVPEATVSYLQTIEKTFAIPSRIASKKSLKSVGNQPKRKLYSVTESSAEEDEPRSKAKNPCNLRELKVVVEKLRLEDHSEERRSDEQMIEQKKKPRPKGAKKSQIQAPDARPEEQDSEGQPDELAVEVPVILTSETQSKKTSSPGSDEEFAGFETEAAPSKPKKGRPPKTRNKRKATSDAPKKSTGRPKKTTGSDAVETSESSVTSAADSNGNSSNTDPMTLPLKKRKLGDDTGARSSRSSLDSVNSIRDPLEAPTEERSEPANAPHKRPKNTVPAKLNGQSKRHARSPATIRYYPDDNPGDVTWKPKNYDSGIEDEDSVRRSKRRRRDVSYRPLTLEQLVEADMLERKARAKKKKPTRPAPVAELEPAASSSGTASISRPATSANVSEVGVAEVASDEGIASSQEAGEDPLLREKEQALSWIRLLASGEFFANGNNEHLIASARAADYMHISMDQLLCKEHQGIRYYFYTYSETNNFGFLRLSPHAEKKLTKTKKFVLKFLVVSGSVVFEVNDKPIPVKAGDFMMLQHDTKFLIRNSSQESLLFMMKYTSPSL